MDFRMVPFQFENAINSSLLQFCSSSINSFNFVSLSLYLTTDVWTSVVRPYNEIVHISVFTCGQRNKVFGLRGNSSADGKLSNQAGVWYPGLHNRCADLIHKVTCAWVYNPFPIFPSKQGGDRKPVFISTLCRSEDRFVTSAYPLIVSTVASEYYMNVICQPPQTEIIQIQSGRSI